MTSTTFTNNKGIEEDINFKVIKVKVEKVEDGKAYCKLLLQIKDNPKLTNTISFGELLYKITGIPYGLLSYNVELTLS